MCNIISILLYTLTLSAQDLSICEGKGQEQCRWALICAKDPKNPNKQIPLDCAQHYKEPEPQIKVQSPAEPTPVKKEKSALETLYYVDGSEEEQEKIINERQRRQAERAVNSEDSK